MGEDYYRTKITSYMRGYGGEYDFCRFYCAAGSLAGGNVMLLGANAVVSGVFTDIAELEEFLIMNAPDSIEMPKGIAARLKMPGYERLKRTLYRLPVFGETLPPDFEEGLDVPVSLQQMFMILNACFEGLAFEGWYTDMSHRVRHGISEVFTYKNGTCASIDFRGGENAYISGVATVPAMRGQGNAGNMLKFISGKLKKACLQGYLWADEKSAGFYERLSFPKADEDEMFIKIHNKK